MHTARLAIALLATGMIALPATSEAANGSAHDRSGWFVNGSVGRSGMDSGPIDDNTSGHAINFGYRWGSIGIEAGYVDIGHFSTDLIFANDPTVTDNAKAHLRGFNLGVNGHFNVTDKWFISARAGALHLNENVTVAGTNLLPPVFREHSSGTVAYAGLGFGYDFTPRFGIGLNYDYFPARVGGLHYPVNHADLISFSAEYRF